MQHGISQRQALTKKAAMLGCELLPVKNTMSIVQFQSGGDPFLLGYKLTWEEANAMLDDLADQRGVAIPKWKSLQAA